MTYILRYDLPWPPNNYKYVNLKLGVPPYLFLALVLLMHIILDIVLVAPDHI